jgi:hypothetical protein
VASRGRSKVRVSLLAQAEIQGASADVYPLNPNGGMEIPDWEHVRAVPFADAIINASVYCAGSFNKRRAFLNNGPRQFLEFLANSDLPVDQDSLLSYRAILESTQNLAANSKYQTFQNVLKVVKELQHRCQVPDFDLPKPLPRTAPIQKKSFISLSVASQNPQFDRAVAHAAEIKFKGRVDDATKATIALAVLQMEAVAAHAEKEIRQIKANYEFVQNALSKVRLEDLRGSPFKAENGSFEYALTWMVANYGFRVPGANELREKLGKSLVSKFGGTVVLQQMLCPTSDALAPFAALLLADSDCCPNADDVRCYTFLNCVQKGEGKRSRIVKFGKLRGAASEYQLELPSDRFLLSALEFLSAFVSTVIASGVPVSPTGKFENQTRLFLHYDRYKTSSLKDLDAGTYIDALRRFMSRAAAEHPILLPIIHCAPENFRTTHGTISNFTEGIFATKRKLRHARVTTTVSYVAEAAVQASVTNRIYAYQEFLLKNAKSLEDAEASQASPTGLGLFCKRQAEDVCSHCDICEKSECEDTLIVLEDPATVAVWIRMQGYLAEMRQYMEQNYPDRWMKVWLPKLALYVAMLAKTSSKVKVQAAKIAVDLPVPALT